MTIENILETMQKEEERLEKEISRTEEEAQQYGERLNEAVQELKAKRGEKQQKEEARFLRSLLELDGTTRINAELAEGLIESMYLYGDGRLEINFGFKEAVEHE